MKITNAAMGLAVGGLAVGAGLVVVRMLARGRGDLGATTPEPPSPEQLIGAPQARLSASEAAETFGGNPQTPH